MNFMTLFSHFVYFNYAFLRVFSGEGIDNFLIYLSFEVQLIKQMKCHNTNRSFCVKNILFSFYLKTCNNT